MTKNPADLLLDQHLDYLKLPYLKENCQPLAAEGATNHWSHLDYLGRLPSRAPWTSTPRNWLR